MKAKLKETTYHVSLFCKHSTSPTILMSHFERPHHDPAALTMTNRVTKHISEHRNQLDRLFSPLLNAHLHVRKKVYRMLIKVTGRCLSIFDICLSAFLPH